LIDLLEAKIINSDFEITTEKHLPCSAHEFEAEEYIGAPGHKTEYDT
jgi:hypothetical protein